MTATSAPTARPTTQAAARSAEIVREYGPFTGAERIHGVTHDGRRVWAATETCMIAFDPADGDVRHRAEAAFGEIFAAAMDLGGTITGEHGVGAAKRGYLQARLGADQMALLRRLKAAFDPAGILNPGKLGS